MELEVLLSFIGFALEHAKSFVWAFLNLRLVQKQRANGIEVANWLVGGNFLMLARFSRSYVQRK